jgi:hypothetical protein
MSASFFQVSLHVQCLRVGGEVVALHALHQAHVPTPGHPKVVRRHRQRTRKVTVQIVRSECSGGAGLIDVQLLESLNKMMGKLQREQS